MHRWSGLATLDSDARAVRSLTAQRVARIRTPYSLVQLRVQAAVSGTTVAFHEEHLPDQQTRALRKDHWAQVLDDLASVVCAGPTVADVDSHVGRHDLPASRRAASAQLKEIKRCSLLPAGAPPAERLVREDRNAAK